MSTLLFPPARYVHVVILARAQGALSIVVPPPFKPTREQPAALLVRTPDFVHRVSNAPLFSVIPISKLRRRALSTLKLLHSWTNGCANSLKGCQLSRLTVPHFMGPLSTPTVPHLTLRPIHLDHLIVAEETADVSLGFVCVLGSVLVTAVARGVEKATLRVCLLTPRARCPTLGWITDGIFRLVIGLGSSPNLGFPRTGPPRER